MVYLLPVGKAIFVFFTDYFRALYHLQMLSSGHDEFFFKCVDPCDRFITVGTHNRYVLMFLPQHAQVALNGDLLVPVQPVPLSLTDFGLTWVIMPFSLWNLRNSPRVVCARPVYVCIQARANMVGPGLPNRVNRLFPVSEVFPTVRTHLHFIKYYKGFHSMLQGHRLESDCVCMKTFVEKKKK